MHQGRVTIGKLLAVIVFFSVVFAGVRSGSNDWFKSIYTLTFLGLVYAAIASRYRGPFLHGFAVAGWAYFLIGFGPWIGSPPGSEPLRAVNRNLVTSVVLELVSGTMARGDQPPPGTTGRAMIGMMITGQNIQAANTEANRNGICHCSLTILFALAGGQVSRSVARRARTDGPVNARE